MTTIGFTRPSKRLPDAVKEAARADERLMLFSMDDLMK